MRKRRHVIGYLFGLTLALAGLTSAAIAQTTPPKGNGKIAFVSTEGGPVFIENASIYVMNPDGGGRAQLTFTQIMCPPPNRPPGYGCGPDQLDYSPAWSPDGKQIALIRSVSALNFRYDHDVFVMNADGSDQRRLTLLEYVHILSHPAWSPDGTMLAFVGPHIGDYYSQVYVMNADGSGPRPVGRGVDPAWSPDGSKLAFASGGLHLMNPDGSGRTQITAPKNPSAGLGDYDWGPAWSPDGTRIIFNRSVGCDWDDSCQSITIWTVNADGSNPTKLADIEAYGRLAWSPDGTKIVFSSNGDLFTMGADGSNVTNITNTPGESEWLPSWQAVALAPPPAPNPIDDPQFFVRQHYLDFLSREPEPSGLAAWLNVLNSCPVGDRTCQLEQRLTTSAAFFGSPEFQLKGYFVFRFYKLALNRLQEYGEIVADMQSVTGQTPAEVYARKATFTDAFSQRSEFVNRFGALAQTDYVAALLSRYGLSAITTPDPAQPDGSAKVTLTQAELVSRLEAGTLTRAQVLRAVADSEQVLAAEFNQAFVAMQYYGYLRRTPEVAGYNAWLTYLNAHPTDFRTMVHGFVYSIEYRSRFGQP